MLLHLLQVNFDLIVFSSASFRLCWNIHLRVCFADKLKAAEEFCRLQPTNHSGPAEPDQIQ